MMNRTDSGLLRSLNRLTASAASATPAAGGASIAAHVDHLRYGLSLLNRWRSGERDPWSTADWTASWKRSIVTDQDWTAQRRAFEAEVRTWLEALGVPRDYSVTELNDVIVSIAHLAYHFGAIR